MKAAELAISKVTDQVELVKGDIGFSAYEMYGDPLPYETLDQVGRCGTVICGPTADFTAGDSTENPLGTLKSQLDLYARSRTFMSLVGGRGAPGTSLTIWENNIDAALEVTETEEVDGVTISKYIRSEFLTRMMGAALKDLQVRGGTDAVCIANDNLFPESSRIIRDSFQSVFGIEGVTATYSNITDWTTDVIAHPERYSFMVVSDIYAAVAESIAAGLTWSDRLFPTRYVGENNTFITLGSRGIETCPVTALLAASDALSNLGFNTESHRIRLALEAVLATSKPTSMNGTMTADEFTDTVVSLL